ncbi:type II toxin-antitoxin system TacA family antitoxin [Castellaniella caeni]|uniref:type II toxin-antitoxin system TacA family antitoxin n=1 Tax=Castellaniella caeni TaxID=266123 RepID=UPI00083050A8|nr:DUF1778 domain-containing protein [Castellaniella caeni]
MSAATDTKQERINLRLKESAKQVLERAARFEGKTVSSFILTSALAHAEKTIDAHQVMHLNTQDSEAFFNALVKPVRFNKKLATAFKEHEQRVTRG